VLAAAIKKVGQFDLVLCGRQASDFDQAQVPLGLAELLKLPCVTIAQKVEVKDKQVTVHRALTDGTEVMEAPLPALVTVSNELGAPRYPTLRGIMAASRKQPTQWKLADLGLNAASVSPRVEATQVFVPTKQKNVEFISGDTDEEKGWNLARKLRAAKLI